MLTVLTAISAGEIENKTDKAKFGLAQSYMNLSDFDNANPLLQELYAKYPEDEDVVMNLLLVYSEKQQYEPAITLCMDFLKNNGDNKTIRLWLARCLSWDKQYDESLEIYSNLIAQYSDWEIPAREKARVLGWSRQYDDAVEEYRHLAERDPNTPVFGYEMAAKQNLYNRFPISAMKHYKQWLSEEPDNPEAMYDLAQIYSTQQQWSNAANMYERILAQYPSHFRAKQALDKVRMYSQDTKVRAGFKMFESDSASRITDTRYWNAFASVTLPLNENTYVNIRQDNIWRNFDNYRQIYQQQFGVELEYKHKPDFWGSVNFAASAYENEKGVEYLFGGELNIKPVDELTVTLSHQRRQIIDNSKVFLDKLYADNFGTRVLYQPTRHWVSGADYFHAAYSDGNKKDAYGADVGYYLSFEPDSLKLSYRHEIYHFSILDPDYFSPASFHSNRLRTEWRHYFNADELFWGTNDTYSTVQYEVIFDDGNQIGHQIRCGFHHDFNDRCSSYLEWSKMIYEHADIYSEDMLMFYTSIYF